MPDNDWRSLRDDLRARPRNRTFRDLARVLEAAGFEATPGKGSHINFKKHDYPTIVTIPQRRGSMPIGYAKQALKAVQASSEE